MSTIELARTCLLVSISRAWPILVPAPVVAEVGYPLARAGGAQVAGAFLRSIVQQVLTVIDLEIRDYERMAELLSKVPA